MKAYKSIQVINPPQTRNFYNIPVDGNLSFPPKISEEARSDKITQNTAADSEKSTFRINRNAFDPRTSE
jgi:hypothetical protein